MDPSEKRWQVIDASITELALVERMHGQPIADFKDRLVRLKALHERVTADEALLKEHVLRLVRERNLYAEKISHIWDLGEARNWVDEKGVLASIRSEIEAKNDLARGEV